MSEERNAYGYPVETTGTDLERLIKAGDRLANQVAVILGEMDQPTLEIISREAVGATRDWHRAVQQMTESLQ